MVEGGGFEPPKAEPSDLQSDPFDRSGTPPQRDFTLKRRIMTFFITIVNHTGDKKTLKGTINNTTHATMRCELYAKQY
jgi:hypothetical protein